MTKTRSEKQKEYEKRTSYSAAIKYQREKTTSLNIRLINNTEQDIIQKLATVSNKSGYIKNLIRQDINNTDPPNH